MIRLYHTTTRQAADAILARGFSDGAGSYGLHDARTSAAVFLTGVWLSDVPLDENEGAQGDVLLAVDLDLEADELRAYEFEEGWPEALVRALPRVFVLPAEVVNTRGRARLVPHPGRF